MVAGPLIILLLLFGAILIFTAIPALPGHSIRFYDSWPHREIFLCFGVLP